MKKRQAARRRMTEEELKEARERLIAREDQLWQEIRDEMREDAREEYQALIQIIGDNSDRALAELEESTIFGVVKLKADEIEGIKGALGRMEEGLYGRCIDCDRWIRPARLKVVPFAVCCLDCQEKRERIKGV